MHAFSFVAPSQNAYEAAGAAGSQGCGQLDDGAEPVSGKVAPESAGAVGQPSAAAASLQGEVACLRNAMLSKLLDAEEKLRAAAAEHEATSRCA